MVLNAKQPESNRNTNAEESELIESLFKYPSLETVFDRTDASRLTAMKRRMQTTVDDLERVIRRGKKEDAGKAAKVVEAYRIAVKFLDELEKIRQASGR